MAGEGMQIAWTSIKRRLRDNDGDGVFLLVKTPGAGGSPAELVADVNAAVDEANQSTNQTDDLVWGEFAVATEKGPVVNLDSVSEDSDLERWLTAFATTLSTAGREGTIEAAPKVKIPSGLSRVGNSASWPAAQMAFTVSDPAIYGYPLWTWLVDPQTTQAICQHASEWTHLRNATSYIGEGTVNFNIDDGEPAELLAKAISRSARALLLRFSSSPWAWRVVVTDDLGKACYSAGRQGASWQDLTDDLRGLLIHHGPSLDLGFLRRRPGLYGSFSLSGEKPDFPFVDPILFDFNRHTFAHYVPDAHSIQVLTGSHLEKANSLSGWRTKDLGNDRYLVEAPDLDPWFTGVEDVNYWGFRLPEPAVLEQARADFGSMILTEAVLSADPQAWLPGRPTRPITRPRPSPTSRPARGAP